MRQLKITKSITNRESASLDKYLQEIGREELISVEEEVELAGRIRNGDRAALEKLTKSNLRFVVSVAKQYQNQGLSLPDLINEGNLGLIKAAEKFDETRGFKFISYAVWWMMNVYANFFVRSIRLRFFFQYQHLNHLFMKSNIDYLSMPGYPTNPDIFRAGLAWHFYN